MTELENKVSRLACWKGPVELAPLKGGLTNISFVVTCRGEKFVAAVRKDGVKAVAKVKPGSVKIAETVSGFSCVCACRAAAAEETRMQSATARK